MTAEAILYAAAKAISDRSSVRDDELGKSMFRTVEMFNALVDRDMTEEEGWLFMACVKQGRSQQGEFHVDDYIDAASYIALAGECAARDVRPTGEGGSMGEDLPEGFPDGWLEFGSNQTDIGERVLDLFNVQGGKTE